MQWAEEAEQKFDMQCTIEEGRTEGLLSFTRTGVSGTLAVTKNQFELNAKLGFLLGAFKERVESEIAKNLDDLLAQKPAGEKSRGRTSATRHNDNTSSS